MVERRRDHREREGASQKVYDEWESADDEVDEDSPDGSSNGWMGPIAGDDQPVGY